MSIFCLFGVHELDWSDGQYVDESRASVSCLACGRSFVVQACRLTSFRREQEARLIARFTREEPLLSPTISKLVNQHLWDNKGFTNKVK